MTYRLSDAVRNVMCNAAVDSVDGGSGPGILRVYTGSAPAGPSTAATGTKLLEFTLHDNAYGDSASGTATLDVSSALTALGLAAGTAGWFRVLDSSLVACFDGTVGVEATFSNTSVTIGLSIQLTSGTFTVPAS